MKSDFPRSSSTGDSDRALPNGWILAKLGDICEVILGQSPPSSTYNEMGDGLPFYQGKLEFGDIYPTPRKWCSTPKKQAEKGDVLISVRAPVGPTNICPETSCIGRGLAAIRGLGGIQPLFILYLMRAFEDIIAGKGAGTTFNAITGAQLRGLEIPLPPLAEQYRIVSKIEELFTRLDGGIGYFKKIEAQVKRYRQSVLKYAFDGRLTKEWRSEQQCQNAPSRALLEQVETERSRRRTRKKQEPAIFNTSDLATSDFLHDSATVDSDPALPEGWIKTTLSVATQKVTDGAHYTPRYVSEGYPFITISNVRQNLIDFSAASLIGEEDFNKLRGNCNPHRGDILFSKDGTVGKVIEVDFEKKFIVLSSLAIIRPYSEVTLPRYLKYLLQSRLVLDQAARLKSGTEIGRAHV